MPLATDPNQTFKVVLESDKGKNPEPCFIFRYATKRQMMELVKIVEAINESENDNDMPFDDINELFILIAKKLVDWKNMGRPFDANELDDLLSVTEAFEILFKLVSQLPDPADKKKCESASHCGTGESVEGASHQNAKNNLTETTALQLNAQSVTDPVVITVGTSAG